MYPVSPNLGSRSLEGEGKRSRKGGVFAAKRIARIAFKYLFSQRAWWNSCAASPTSGARLRWYRRRSARYHCRSRAAPLTPRKWEFPSKFHSCSRKFVSGSARSVLAASRSSDSTPFSQTFHFCALRLCAQVLYLASRRTTCASIAKYD